MTEDTVQQGNLKQDEAELVKRAIHGDAAAFGELYSLYRNQIYRYIFFRVESDRDAEDLTHQVFLKAWEAMPGYEHRGHPFSSWLYRIAHNTTVSYLRRQRSVPMSLLNGFVWPDEKPTSLEKIIQAEENAALNAAIAELPPEQQQVIYLRFDKDLKHDEVAQIIDKSPGASRMIQHRALASLEQMLNGQMARVVGVVLALWLVVGSATVYASTSAVPGDLLYPVKRSVERAAIALTRHQAAEGNFHVQFAQRRVEEALELSQRSRFHELEQSLTDYTVDLFAALALLQDESALAPEERFALAERLLTLVDEHEAEFVSLLDQVPSERRPAVRRAQLVTQAVRTQVQPFLDADSEPTNTVPLVPGPLVTPTPALPLDLPDLSVPALSGEGDEFIEGELPPSTPALEQIPSAEEILEKVRDELLEQQVPDITTEAPIDDAEPAGDLPVIRVPVPEPLSTALPDLPTALPESPTALPDLPASVQDVPTALPELPTALPTAPPQLPDDVAEPPAEGEISLPDLPDPEDLPAPPESWP